MLQVMQVTVDIPDEFMDVLAPAGENLSRRFLEDYVAQVYREGKLTTEEVRRALGLASRFEVEAFLGRYQICDFTVEDFREDVANLKQMRQHA